MLKTEFFQSGGEISDSAIGKRGIVQTAEAFGDTVIRRNLPLFYYLFFLIDAGGFNGYNR